MNDPYMNVSRKRNTLDLLDVYLRGRILHYQDDGPNREVMHAHLETVIAIRRDVDELDAIHNFSDNNPAVLEARRWYSRLHKSALIDSTITTRVGVLLAGLDATIAHRRRLEDAAALAESRLEKAREFVRLRWRHLSDCPEVGSHANAVDLKRCNCGLKVALADLGAVEE